MKIFNFLKQHRLVISLSLLIVCFSFFCMFFLYLEPDYYWHITAGKYMVTHHEILQHDVFSWIASGKYWMSHEWLFEVFLYGLKTIFGKFHVFIYCFFTVTLLGLFLFFTNLKSYLKNIPFALLWITFFILAFFTISCRPHLLSFFFLAITIYLLRDLFYHPQSKKIYGLPLLSVLWANIHGGSSNLPYLLCLLFIFCGLFQFRFSKLEAVRIQRKQLITYVVVMLLCILAICINPHGIKMVTYPYQNMSDSLMLTTIAEWQPTNLNNLSHYSYIVFVVFVFMTLIFSDKKIRLLDFILFLFALYLGFKSIRFWFYAYIISSFFIFYYVKRRKQDPFTVPLISLIAVGFLSFFVTQFDYTSRLQQTSLSTKAIQVLKKEQPNRLYNEYDYGGYLIHEGILVFMDGRADLYSPYNYKDYQDISRLAYNFTSLIEKYDFDYFVLKRKTGLSSFLANNSTYEQVFKDKSTVIYKKKTA